MDTKYIKSIKAKPVLKGRHKHYNPSTIKPDRYTITKGNWQLFELMLEIRWTDSDHPDDVIFIGDDEDFGILFWSKAHHENDAIKSFLDRLTHFISILDTYGHNFSYVINNPLEFDHVCYDWLSHYDKSYIKMSGNMLSVITKVDAGRYIFKKYCESLSNLFEKIELEQFLKYSNT